MVKKRESGRRQQHEGALIWLGQEGLRRIRAVIVRTVPALSASLYSSWRRTTTHAALACGESYALERVSE